MYYSKKNQEPIVEQQTDIWTCSKDNCSCWMREDLSFDKEPTCPMCGSDMLKDTKMLPPLFGGNFKTSV
ncbi:cold-shock protein [Brevibacillus ginsengisoli]|uniref:cold-shock protein n=1 Tax=Brevibacillus ginsengisoli TaxID=363854 RepID=UPI003CEAE6DA